MCGNTVACFIVIFFSSAAVIVTLHVHYSMYVCLKFSCKNYVINLPVYVGDVVAMKTRTMVTTRHVEKTVPCWLHLLTITRQWESRMSLVHRCRRCTPV